MHPLRLSVLSLALALPAMAAHADPLAPEDAAKHVGEKATVCGIVAGAKYAAQTGGRPTFLDFGKPYPDTIFTALILGSDRPKFGTPEKTVQGKEVCVTGEIRLYNGKPEIILSDPKQLVAK
jgi:DNA/RNA endonuclease YhcR with UshA esterase domain